MDITLILMRNLRQPYKRETGIIVNCDIGNLKTHPENYKNGIREEHMKKPVSK